MINLKSLIDLLPYYFKEQDTYKVNGKGLLEHYLDIFGNYFDDQIVNNIDTLDDIINIDKTPEIYLGYLWEFLGSMPYANPKAIDPEKWKQYFNGFNDDSTIEALSKLWLYRKDGDNYHYNLTTDQVRSLVKYSVALFSIRGTKKFFEVFLRLYGFKVSISTDNSVLDQDNYIGSDDDYAGSDDNYAGAEDPFIIKVKNTKIDSEWSMLDQGITMDNHCDCARFVNVNFTLTSDHTYTIGTEEFKRLQDRMFNLINMFLPIGTRPHLIWNNVNVGNGFVAKVDRYLEVYVDRLPIPSDYDEIYHLFEASDKYPGWYKYIWDNPAYIHYRDWDWSPVKFMVRVIDTFSDTSLMGQAPAFISDQPKRFKVAFNGSDYSDTEYEDGHVFTLNPGGLTNSYYPTFKVSVVCENDFNLNHGTIKTLIIHDWLKEYNYTLFKHHNNSVSTKLTSARPFVPILIQSAFVRTYTKDANPGDDNFIPKAVVNLTTGQYLTLCETGTPTHPGDDTDYSIYEDMCIYLGYIEKPGTYEFCMIDKPEYVITIKVTSDDEVLNLSLVEGLANNVVDVNHSTCNIRLKATSNLNYLNSVHTLPLYIYDSGNIWPTVRSNAGENDPGNKVGNLHNKPYYHLNSNTNLLLLNQDSSIRNLPVTFKLAYLSQPKHTDSQYFKLIFTYHDNPQHSDWFKEIQYIYYPVSGKVYIEQKAVVGIDDIYEEYIYEYTYGDEVIVNGTILSSIFQYGNMGTDSNIESNGTSIYVKGINSRTLNFALSSFDIDNEVSTSSLYFEYNGLYDPDIVIKETTNPVTKYWNNGEIITLEDPGHYRYYGFNDTFNEAISNYVDVNVLSNKYNALYYLDVEDGDKSDDENYMLRTLIPAVTDPDTPVEWGFDFSITVDKSVLEARDILVTDPDAFDFEVLLYKGGEPNRGTFLRSVTANIEVLVDELGNLLPNYKVKGSVALKWLGSYTLGPNNYPPGLYCLELHDKNHTWPGTSSYRVVDAYTIPQQFPGNLYFDVDVISKAWTSPAGQSYEVDPITGKYTWGWYKTNDDQRYSVRLVRYDPSISVPQFRLKLTNNTIGYTRVYMYKLVDNGDEWDSDAAYPSIIPPINSAGLVNPHWLNEAIPKDWGFPGEYDYEWGEWDYGKGVTGIPGYKGRWLFTGSIYQLGSLITGPQEPGKYIFIINQLNSIDHETINYAYLEVRESIDYTLVVDPRVDILQGTAVGTQVSVVSSALFTKENLAVTVVNPDGTEILEFHPLPYAFYAYQAGDYTFKLYKLEGGQWVYLGLTGTFKVLTDNGVSTDYLTWGWSDISDREVQVVTTSQGIDWTVTLQD